MVSNPAIKRKQYALNEKKIKRAQKLLRTKTDTETIERALDEVISGSVIVFIDDLRSRSSSSPAS
jgi:hypothetical protein